MNWIQVGNRALDLDAVREISPWYTEAKSQPCLNVFFKGVNDECYSQFKGVDAERFLELFKEKTGIALKLLDES